MRNTWTEAHLSVLQANVAGLRRMLGPEPRIMFVVKSDAYGHGMASVAQAAWDAGVDWFVVAHMEEATLLRSILPEASILLVGVISARQARALVDERIVPMIVSCEHARDISGAVSGKVSCHVKVDTGMGRLGVLWQQAVDEIARIRELDNIDVTGLCTHFASSDSADGEFAGIQYDRFDRVSKECATRGMGGLFRHASNSAAVLREEVWQLDGVRTGILLYGYGPGGFPRREDAFDTSPFLHWKTRVLQVRDIPAGFPVSYDSTHVTERATRIATVDVGYADGYHRALSNKGVVLVGGMRCPVIGRVTMNLTLVDLGPDAEVRVGDEVVLMGEQGDVSVWADELARLAGTIPYEILTSIRTDDRRVSG